MENDIKTTKPKSDFDLFVRKFYYQSLDKKTKETSGIIADDGCYELIFIKEKNVCLEYSKIKKTQLPSCFTLHKIMPPFRFEFYEKLTVFGVKLQPWANSLIIPNNLPEGVLNLQIIYNPSIDLFHKNLFNQENFETMVEMSYSFLFSNKIKIDNEILFIKSVCEKIYSTNGNISVQDLSLQFRVNRQKLNRKFKTHVKYNLKYFIKLIRMRAIIKYKIKNIEVTLTQAAYQFGYYDQAHFINDFKKICGTTPSSFIKDNSYSFNDLR